VDGALREGTTAGNLVLAQSERLEPQHFFQLAHGQPLLWQLGVLHFQWTLSPPRLPCAPLQSYPISVPNYHLEVIGFSSEH
jgi:hypothetical protein